MAWIAFHGNATSCDLVCFITGRHRQPASWRIVFFIFFLWIGFVFMARPSRGVELGRHVIVSVVEDLRVGVVCGL